MMAFFVGTEWESRYANKWTNEYRTNIEMNEFFFSFKNVLEKKSYLNWHSACLKRYVNEKICPYGLRVQLFPNFKVENEDF